MSRLPQPGSDSGTWGDILNDYLSQIHKPDGSLKDNSVGAAQLQDNAVTSTTIAPNSVTNTALATNAVNAAIIQDGSITEQLLETGVRNKLNTAGAGGESVYGIPTLTVTTTAPILDRDNYVSATLVLEGVTWTGQMKGRGNSTWKDPIAFPAWKNPLAIKLDTSASLVGMPASKRWALLANFMDPSMIRNAVAFEIGARFTGLDWTPKLRYVNLVMNGMYSGLYQLAETVRAEPARVNVSLASGGSGLPLTGAYLLEMDIYFDTPAKFVTTHDSLPMTLQDPDGTDPTNGTAQLNYIRDWINNFETVLYGASWLNATIGYKTLIDLDSFLDWYLVNELLVSVDGGFRTSCKLYKTRDVTGTPGRLFLGPMWDYDLSLGRVESNTFSSSGWWIRGTVQPGTGSPGSPMPGATWINRMLSDPDFVTALRTRWDTIYPQLADTDTVVDKAAQKILISRRDDNYRWNDRGSWATTSTEVKNWLSARVTWINANLEGSIDATAPSVPTGLASSSITDTGFTVSWSAATDNVGVTGYDISTDDGSSVATTSVTTSKAVTGLTASTAYSVKVRAKDAAGNASAWSSALPVTTSATASGPAPLVQYSFSEGSGSSATSDTGGYTLAGAGSPAWDADAIASKFYGYIAGSTGADFTQWTFAVDIKFTALPAAESAFVFQRDNLYFNILANGKIKFYGSGTTAASTPSVTVGTYQKIVVTQNATTLKVYLDGTEILSSTQANTWFRAKVTDLIFDGNLLGITAITKCRFWDSALSPSDVATLGS